MTSRRLWVAVILNLLFYGCGYIYLGKRKTFGVILLIGHLSFYAAFALALLSSLPPTIDEYVNINGLGFGILSLAFAYDAYRLGKGETS